MGTLAARWRAIQESVRSACDASGRDSTTVTVVAVTKTVEVSAIQAAYDLGIRDFGESRLQEALPKIESLPADIVWHFVGKLQSNKAKKAAGLFDVLHTIEGEAQIQEVEKSQTRVDCLIEVNLAKEEQKAGVFPENLDGLVQRLLSCKYACYRGLMTVGPLTSDPAQSRAVFRRLAELGKRFGAAWLSMGMSADFDVAIQEGATHVRIGTALFGERG